MIKQRERLNAAWDVEMAFVVTITKTLDAHQVRILRSAMNGVDVYDDDAGQPLGIALLLEAGLMQRIASPRYSGRQYYGLTAKGQALCRANMKEQTIWEHL